MIIIAHRGASAYRPENTISAFKEAIKMKADGIECDVRMTADNKLAVIHDATIDRTTSGKGKVKDYDLNQLKKYGIPELQDVINLIKRTDILLFVEIKDKGSEKQIAEAIKKNKMESRTVIVSFYAESLEKVKNYGIKTGLILSKRPKTIDLKAGWLVPSKYIVAEQLIEDAHKAKLKVLAWTVDDIKLAKKLSDLGVDAISTNKPDLFT
jgi:glycerophosphoryl diester phosphodiesterase